MTPRHPELETVCTQLGHRGRVNGTDRRRTDRHVIVALSHRIAAFHIKWEQARPEAAPSAGGSTP
jgi:hypothetical protein